MTHDFDGKRYEQASDHQREWGATIIDDLRLRGDERILDLGCGDGGLTARLAELVPGGEVVGIDAAPGMIDAAQPKARENLRFVLLDIDQLDFAEEFDLVFSNAVLHWIKDHDRLLANAHRALRPGGRVRFNFAGDGNCVHFFRVIREAMARDGYREHFAAFEWPWFTPTIEEYRSVAGSSRLRDPRVWGENADRHFPDKDAMIRWVDLPCLVPFLPHVPAANRRAFRDYVIDRMVEETLQKDGRCFETFRRINLTAMRFDGELPAPWAWRSSHAVGGLLGVGFSADQRYLLVASTQGRGVIDLTTGERVARDRDDDYPLDESTRRVAGIGPIAGEEIVIAGVYGGTLLAETSDGWRARGEKLFPPGGGAPTTFPTDATYPQASGFTAAGDVFVYATGSDVTLYART